MGTVAVLGGGIGGLAAAYYLCQSSQVTKVILLESSSRFGGWLWSTRRPDGAVFEHGPRGIRPAGAAGRNTLNMVEDLGLGEELLPVLSSHVASQNRFLYVDKQLHKMPSGLSGLLRTTPPFTRPLLVSLLSEVMVRRRSQEEDESIHAFVSRRFGDELADIAVDSLCRGVFAGDCRKLSVRSCFPVLHGAEQRRGSVVLGMLSASGPGPDVDPGPLARRSAQESWAQWSLRGGVQSLPECIADHLRRSGRVQLHTDAAVKRVDVGAAGCTVHLEDGMVSADHLISALPAKALAAALPPPLQPLIQHLQDISSVTVAVVNLEYQGAVLPVQGFGHLVPSSEDGALLGVVYDSVPFPEHNSPDGPTTRLTVMMGGAWFQEALGDPETASEVELLSRAVEAVRLHLGVAAAPSWSRVCLHKDCIPQYFLGHSGKVESMREFIKMKKLRLSLTGSAYDGVAVNDVILSARTAVRAL